MKAKVVKRIIRPDRKWIECFKTIPASVVCDCMNRLYGMRAEIVPLQEGTRVCGPAVTVQCMTAGNMMLHLALTMVEAGDVLVADARGSTANAVWGGIQTVFARKAGVAGLVVDGAVRDVAEIRELKFPVYCKGVTPAGPHKGWADNINVPVQCGGVPVHPGDLIVGDDDGVVVVPCEKVEEIYNLAVKRMEIESGWIESIENGKNTLDAVGLREQLSQMDVEYIEEDTDNCRGGGAA